jgi:thiol-disulfide isomerase/thioredoxin
MVGGVGGLYDSDMSRYSKLFVAGLIAALSSLPLTACTAQAPETVTVEAESPQPQELAQPEEPQKNSNNTIDWGPRRGIWRGKIELPGGKELSFNFVIEFTRDAEKQPIWEIWLRNGSESLPAMIENQNPLNIITFHGTDARIEATVNDSNTGLGGEYIYTRKNSEGEPVEYRLPFRAHCSDMRRFAWLEAGEEPVDAGPLADRWVVSFDERTGPAVAEFVTMPDGINVVGTVMTPTGDDGQLAGSFEQGRLRLSRFTGGSGILYDGTLEPDGTLIGTYRSLAHHAEGFTASPDETAALPDLFELTKWNDGVELSDLSFKNVEGQEVNLSEIAPAGSARLVYVMGTWCHNCSDATRYLTELHERYADEGLTIVGIAFEASDEFQEQAEAVKKYSKVKDVPFQILVAGQRNKSDATETLGALDKVAAYPTVVFVSPDNEVIGVHQGFVGPAAPSRHAQLRSEFEERIESMLVGE